MVAVPVARRALFSEKRRAILGVGGVSLALLIVLTLGGIFDGAMRQVTRYIDTAEADVIVAQPGVRNMHMSSSSIPEPAVREVRNIPGIRSATPILYETSPVQVGTQRELSYVIGYDPGKAGGPTSIEEGEAPEAGEIVLDSQAAEALRVSIDDQVTALGRRWTVSGVTQGLTNITNTISYVRRQDFAEARDLDGIVSYILVEADRPSRAVGNIEESTGLEALTRSRFAEEERRIVQDMSADIMRIMTLSGLLIGLAVVVLVLYSATLSRLREIGVMKALGASNSQVARFVVVQAAWTVTPALAVAVAATLGFDLVLRTIGSDVVMWLSPSAGFRVGVLALALGLVGSLAPLFRVVKVEPSSVFRR